MSGLSATDDRDASAAGGRRDLHPGSAELARASGTVAAVALRHPHPLRWLLFAGPAALLLAVLAGSVGWLLWIGPGIWGNNIPVTWALDIIGYDWWIGIASGGLALNAAMLLLGSPLRGGINRIGQTVSLCAAGAAALYPILHLGRPWFFYWNMPYPNQLDLWPQWRSPLAWDAMAIVSFLGIALSLWYVGLIPDLAMLRDRAPSLWKARLYGLAALGWRGSALHWARWAEAQRVQSGLALLLVLSLQAGAAVMFAGTLEPGWHDPLLPLFFLVNAVFSGIAATALGAIAIRVAFGLDALVTWRHLEFLGYLLLAAGLAATWCYFADFFTTAYGGDRYDRAVLAARLSGRYAWSTWLIFGLALLPVHLLWIPNLRRSPTVLASVSLLVLTGLWMDRYMILVITLDHDFLPSAHHLYRTTIWGIGLFIGTVGLFAALLLLFLRALPAISLVELRREADRMTP